MHNSLFTAQRMALLEQRLKDLRARLPAHSATPKMMMEIEELEEELEQLKAELEEQRR
ncbi:MAG: histidine kinase [Chloroflexi bacterium]|nr:histidine kinase [Chloroflexota bacterium]